MFDQNQVQKDTIKVELSDGTIVLMDYSDSYYSDEPVSVQGFTIAAQQAFGAIKGLATDLKQHIKAASPDRASIEFSLELEKKGGDVLSKICNASGKGGVKIKLEWDFKQ